MELTKAVAARFTTKPGGITSTSVVLQSSPSASPAASAPSAYRSAFLQERHHLRFAGAVRNDRISGRILARCSAEQNCWAAAERENGVRTGHAQVSSPSLPVMDRRELLGKVISALMSSIAFPALAASGNGAEDGFLLYQDETDKYSLLVPQEWVKGEGSTKERSKNTQRKVTAFYPEDDTSANVNIVITGLAADYTSLGSFGTVDMFAETLVNSLDRAWQKPPGQNARLIDDSSRNGMYYVEYTVQKPGEAQRHLLSVIGIANNGWYNRLYTVTAQYMEEDADKYKARLKKVDSLGLRKLRSSNLQNSKKQEVMCGFFLIKRERVSYVLLPQRTEELATPAYLQLAGAGGKGHGSPSDWN